MFATRPCRFLGRVSYSLHLTHRTVLVLLASYVTEPLGSLGVIALMVGVLAVSLVTTEILYRLAEAPGMTLDRRLCGRSAKS